MLRRKQQTNQPMNFSQKSGGQSATSPKTNSTQNLGAAGLRKLLFAAGIASVCASCQSPQAPTATTPGISPGTSPAATPAVSSPGDPNTVKIVSMLPMTGSALGQSQTMVNGIQQALAETDSKACDGKIQIQYEVYDDATAAAGKWGPAK